MIGGATVESGSAGATVLLVQCCPIDIDDSIDGTVTVTHHLTVIRFNFLRDDVIEDKTVRAVVHNQLLAGY